MSNDLWWSTIPENFFPLRKGKDPRFTFLDALPEEIRDKVMGYLSPHRNIFVKEVLEKEDDFKLYATFDEIDGGIALNWGFWRMRKSLYYLDERWGAQIHYKRLIYGGDHKPTADNSIKYVRGQKVPLWWIRMRDDPSPFYVIGNVYCANLKA